jgi:CrcB protein
VFSFSGLEKAFLTGIGGFTGVPLRFIVSSITPQIKNIAETLTVDLLWNIVLAFLTFSSELESMVYLVNIGIIGSFTTFSTSAYETFKLLEEGENLSFFLSISWTFMLCLRGSLVYLVLVSRQSSSIERFWIVVSHSIRHLAVDAILGCSSESAWVPEIQPK